MMAWGILVENFEEDLRELNTCNLGNIKREKGKSLWDLNFEHRYFVCCSYVRKYGDEFELMRKLVIE